MASVVDTKMIAYGAIVLSGFSAIMLFALPMTGIFGYVKVLLALLCAFAAVLALVIYKYGYVVIPWFTKNRKMTTPLISTGLSYEIPPTNDVVIGVGENVYYATAYIGVRIVDSPSEKGEEELGSYMRSYERAISGLRYVAKLSLMVYVKDLGKEKDRIQEKIYGVQYRLNREREKPDPDPINLEKLENELAAWNSMLHRFTSGNRPMAVVAYIMTTAIGVSREQATAAAKRQAEELRTLFGNALNVDAKILTAEEMLRCFHWELMIPKEYADLEQQLQ